MTSTQDRPVPAVTETESEIVHSDLLQLVELELIVSGLRIECKENRTYYTYGVYAGGSTSSHVGLNPIVEGDELIEGDHIRCLTLAEGDDLGKLVEKYQNTDECMHLKALIIINTRDDFNVKTHCLYNKCDLPVLVLKDSDGKKLLELLECNTDVKGKVEVESYQDGSQSSLKEEGTTKERIKPRSVRGYKHDDIKSEIKRVLFHDDGQTPITLIANPGAFEMIICIFQNYEKMTKGNGRHGKALMKLIKGINIGNIFAKDFPFYIILAHRIRKFEVVYEGEEAGSFIKLCIRKTLDLDATQLVSTMEAFIKSDGISENILQWLEDACMNFATHSYKRIYKKMVWVILALKCNVISVTRTRNHKDIWNIIVKKIMKLSFASLNTIEDIKCGLLLTKQLNIPSSSMMSIEQIIMMASEIGIVRPLSHLANYLDCVVVYIPDKVDFEQLIGALYEKYLSWMFDYYPLKLGSEVSSSKVSALSIAHTISGAIQEGLAFVEQLSKILEQKCIREVVRSLHEQRWLQFLLDLVDVTKAGADEHLVVYFIKANSQVLKKHQTELFEKFVHRTKESFAVLSCSQFTCLYKSSIPWPNKFAEDYFNSCKVSSSIKVCDDTWVGLIHEVVNRVPGAQNQHFILNFIKSIGEMYTMDSRSADFILDLLAVKVPKLFAVSYAECTLDVAVQNEFSIYLHSYIQTNGLKRDMMKGIDKILSNITEESAFQQLVLMVILKESVPELRTITKNDDHHMNVLRNVANKLHTRSQSLYPQQKFCWGIVAAYCSNLSLIITASNFDWIGSYIEIIDLLGEIFKSYGKGLDTSKATLTIPPNEDLHTFFSWVHKLQEILLYWQRKILHEKECNYDEIMLYASNHAMLLQIGDLFCVPSSIGDLQQIQQTKNVYLRQFERVNGHIIKYIPGDPRAKYCTLPQILQLYGVSFPLKFKQHLRLPSDEVSQLSKQLMRNTPCPNIDGDFQPPVQVSLLAINTLTLKEIIALTEQLDTFVRPILEHMDMLVFFTLHQSEIFNDYVYRRLKIECSSTSVQVSVVPKYALSTLRILSNEQKKESEEDEVSVSMLANVLASTKKHLVSLIQGTATYSDIIAEDGKLNLEAMNIEAEFNVLIAFFKTTCNINIHEGLKGIRCMLELFQYTSTHIPVIRNVIMQYKLEGCLHDQCLEDLVMIAEEIEGSKASQIPCQAVAKVEHVKSLLCLQSSKASKSLKLFPAVLDSRIFYQFVRDMKFDDDKGQEAFRSQCQLITDILQHEEYNDTVLNHLLAAYNFIFPFMDTKQGFASLMSRVIALDISDMGLKALETVNSNVSLIRLWFSRAEGNTLQNVARDLDCIIETGQFEFEFFGDITLSLLYCPSAAAAAIYPSSEEGAKPQRLSDEKCSRMQRWCKDQIEDFVRKLGFLDAKTKEGEMVKKFLRLNEITNTLLKLYTQLRNLGCDGFINGSQCITILCNAVDLDTMVSNIELKLSSWKDEVSELCARNKFMLFFHIPKLLLLHKRLNGWIAVSNLIDTKDFKDSTSVNEMACIVCSVLNQIIENKTELAKLRNEITKLDNHYDWAKYFPSLYKELCVHIVKHIAREISILFDNNPDAVEMMKKSVEAALNQSKQDFNSCQNFMQTTSVFLLALLQNHSLPTRIINTRKSHRWITTQVLHVCQRFTQKDVMSLIFNIFGGVPESFQVFFCQPSSRIGELDLFLKRAAQFSIQHLILEVNKLPLLLQEHLIQFHSEMEHSQKLLSHPLFIDYIETKPSVLHYVPWIALKEYKEVPKTLKIFQSQLAPSLVQLVYGNAGDGKTHYIKQQLSLSHSSCIIAVNESFTILGAIKKLLQLPSDQTNCSVFFNFTLLPPGRNCIEQSPAGTMYIQLMEVVSWFFFELIILGYVEDKESGLSFRLPGGINWQIYVEVPSRDLEMTPDEMLKLFCIDVPIFGHLVGTPYLIQNGTLLSVDEEVQLVCKYLKAHKEKKIDRLYKDGQLVKFSTDPDMADDVCHKFLKEFMPEHIRSWKITQRLFIKYMVNRCKFLDCFPAFNYNAGFGEYVKNDKGERAPTDTRTLGSSLMKTMLKEVIDFCDSALQANWSLSPHQQLIYQIKDQGGSIDLITLHQEKMSQTEVANFKKLGVNIPSMIAMHSREVLDMYLSRALDVELDSAGHLKPIDDCCYVLTLDYAVKMLSINERYRCGVPVIIEGETGVGKTALLQMLSVLWNHSLLGSWNRKKGHICDLIRDRIGQLQEGSFDDYWTVVQLLHKLAAGDGSITYEDMVLLCKVPGSIQSPGLLYTKLTEYLMKMRQLPVFALLVSNEKELNTLFKDAELNNDMKTTARLLFAVYYAQLKPTFYKLNIHAALTPCEIQELLKPAFDQARELQQIVSQIETEPDLNRGHRKKTFLEPNSNIPFVTVFLDELNTSSCLGLLKELIVDKTLEGEPIPANVFIVAACNPHRGNSLASHDQQDKWLRSSYYVRALHPTLQLIKWDYGSLNRVQEEHYVRAKITRSMPKLEGACLTELIVESQEFMRHCAFEQLKSSEISREEAEVASRSSVSQRDIQRVFTLHEWLMQSYQTKPYGNRIDYHRRAVLVSLGVVYYMRLNAKFREAYINMMDNKGSIQGEVKFSDAFKDELTWYADHMELPQGIAKTLALKENVFATIICTVTQTPLIIVGAPGSSKTLSFNITVSNLKGQESRVDLFRPTANSPSLYPALDPHYYQCSRRTTSNEIQTVFIRAINRQKSLKVSLNINCVVFMDEAGLPEESHESLKVLHYYLDNPEVSFVAITNHVLDAAKTNRAISLFRPETPGDDLETLAMGCLYSEKSTSFQLNLKQNFDTFVRLCQPYLILMEQNFFKQFFGLRDFIHFVKYLKRKSLDNHIDAQVVLESLERNFNGSAEFEKITKQFLAKFDVLNESSQVKKRHILDILRDSLADRPMKNRRAENEVRYKLIIDPSEDDSLVRLLFTFGVLDRQKTRVFVCSDFPGDTHLQKIDTISAILHCAIEGHTVVMAQTDSIHESFYDLFNQRFRRIDDSNGCRYYANVAIGAHSKPCRVHPEFQCVVVVKLSEVENMPAPFLNRFEKYRLTHEQLYNAALDMLPPCMAVVICTVKDKMIDFVRSVGGVESFYGLKNETVDSLLLSMLPTDKHTYQPYEPKADPNSVEPIDVEVLCLQELVRAFRSSAGFYLPTFSLDELKHDAIYVAHFVRADPEFQGLLKNIAPQGVVRAVNEAMQKLHQAPAPNGSNLSVGVSPEACMIIAIAIQWLVLHLCKRLMQLMTPEALTIHRSKINSSYVINYFKFQSHFSLKVLLHNHINTLNYSKEYCPTKLLCFTRSSGLVHKLYSFNEGFVDKSVQESTIIELISDDLEAVMVYKLCNTPQNNVQEYLRAYLDSDTAQILVLVAKMPEVSLPVINHVRVMIEEAENLHIMVENKNENQKCKLTSKIFVLLIHFPPSNFLYPCYPALYLRGWDHFYLDTIGHEMKSGVIKIEDWFTHCCLPKEKECVDSGDDSLLQTAKGFIKEAIRVISSHVPFGSYKGHPFNGEFTISKRNELLNEFLIAKKVGVVLCKLFRSYWRPSVMSGYLEEAARLAHQQQSTLNITDTIQAGFKAIFMDFMVVMVSRMNENCNIDCLFSDSGSSIIDELFRDLLTQFTLPPLEHLKALRNTLQLPRNYGYIPMFPFFDMVMHHVDHMVEQCRKNIHESTDIFSSNSVELHSQPHDFDMQSEFLKTCQLLLSIIEDSTKASSKGCVAISVQAVAIEPELWEHYFNNFIVSKFHLESSESSIETKIIISDLFGNFAMTGIAGRIVYLHTFMAIHPLHLSRMAATFRSLSKIKSISAVSQYEKDSVQHLSSYVIRILFDALFKCLHGGYSQPVAIEEHLMSWYRAYLDIITLPSFAKNLGADLAIPGGAGDMHITELVKAKLNVMRTIFVLLQMNPNCNSEVLSICEKLFVTLFNEYFTKYGQLKIKCPQLSEVCQIAEHCLMTSPAPPEGSDLILHKFIPRMVDHIFTNSTNYSVDDCRWLFVYANSQNHWLPVSTVPAAERTKLYAEHQKLSSNNDKMNIYTFKLYLSRILGTKCETNGSNDILALHNTNFRMLVGEVLMAAPELGPPTYYIPLFYQHPFVLLEQHSFSLRMQQPLAHLYFLIVMEDLLSKLCNLAVLLCAYSNILELCKLSTVSDQDKVLLFIELQAVAQVILQTVAIALDPSDHSRIQQLMGVVEEVNGIIEDTRMGGGACKGHSHVLALHILKHVKSYRRLTDFNIVVSGITCLEQICEALKNHTEPKTHLFPFVGDPSSPLGALCQRVRKSMDNIHEGTGNIQDLINIAQESFTSQSVNTRGAFRIAVWLTVYHDFYDRNRKSEVLCNAIGGDKMSRYFEEGHIDIIQRFLNPDIMLSHPEVPRSREEVQTHKCKTGDPLLDLFKPPKSQTEDQSDVDLRHALANMVAAVIGCPQTSNHLWYHIFAPNELVDSFMTGFMYDSKISHNGCLYNCGVELTPDGYFGHHDYLKHACRGIYTLHSLYFLLWANFGAFCIALLTQPDADKKLCGTIISDSLPIRHYCVSQLKTLWLSMRDNLNITSEQRSSLVTRCMKRFYELCADPASSQCMQGRLLNREQLDSYESLWHTQVYLPSWCQLKEEHLTWHNPVFQIIRSLDGLYPLFPTEKYFIHAMLSSGDTSPGQKQAGELSILTQLVLERPQLLAGESLLPDLVEFYLWMHNQLAYIVSKDRSAKLKIGQVIELAVARSSKEFGKHLKALYERVKDGYNAYIDTIGAYAAKCTREKAHKISDGTILLYLLSDSPEEEEDNDWLYTMMCKIVNKHNNLIEGLYASTRSGVLHTLKLLLPSEPSNIPLTEFAQCHCIMAKNGPGAVSDFVQLLHSRYHVSAPVQISSSKSVVSQDVMKWNGQFDFHMLQQDMVFTYLAGKPLLESAASIRMPFKFRSKDQPKPLVHPKEVAGSGGDVDTLMEQLPYSLQVACDDSTIKTFEYEFHPASYMTLLEAMQAMKNVLSHLINYSKEHKEQSLPATQTLLQFMKQLEIPVYISDSTHMLSLPQQRFLENLPTVMLFSCLQQLIQWLNDGMYDFHTLPFTLMTRLPKEDQDALNEIPTRWKGDMNKLLAELKSLTDILAHSEAHFSRGANDTLQTSMKTFLIDVHFLSDKDKILPLIPMTICIQHYVAFRVALRGLIALIQKHISMDNIDLEDKWTEFIDDLWSKRLPHFRDFSGDGGMFVYDPKTGRYGFDEGQDDNGLLSDLDKLNTEEHPVAQSLCASASERSETPSIEIQVQMDKEASKYSVDQICEFLSTIRMSQYAEVLKSEKIDGEGLLSVDELQLIDIGVSSPLHSFMIKFLFRRTLLQQIPKHPTTVVQNFLRGFKLDHCIEGFMAQGMDGDMLLEIVEKGNKHIFEELGVQSAMDVLTIKAKFKVYIEPALLNPLEKAANSCSVSDIVDFLKGIKMDDYIDTVLMLSLDGEMLLAADDGELEEVLEVQSPLHRFKIKYLFRRHLEGNSTASQSPISPEIEKLVPKCAQEDINGDMLQRIVQLENCDAILKELGVTIGNRNKIKKMYATIAE